MIEQAIEKLICALNLNTAALGLNGKTLPVEISKDESVDAETVETVEMAAHTEPAVEETAEETISKQSKPLAPDLKPAPEQKTAKPDDGGVVTSDAVNITANQLNDTLVSHCKRLGNRVAIDKILNEKPFQVQSISYLKPVQYGPVILAIESIVDPVTDEDGLE